MRSDDEQGRIADLLSFQITDRTESDLQQVAELARDLLDVPIALINLVHNDHLRVKAKVGLEAERVPRDIGFCSNTIMGSDVFVVEDLKADARFADNPLVVGEAGFQFYAGAPLRSSSGHNVGTVCVLDTAPRASITEKQLRILRRLSDLVMDKLEMRRLQIADTVAAQFAKSTSEAFLCVDAVGGITYWNRAAETLFGYAREECIGRSLDIIVPERFQGAHGRGMGRVAAGGTSKLAGRTVELVAKRRDGTEFPIELLISVWEEHGTRGMGAIIRDISERRNQQARLEHMALNDQLTGIPNRFQFAQRLREALAEDAPLSVIMFDLDGFKAVNDSLGHATGDTLLQALTIRMLACLGATTTLARLGGDEFAVLLPRCGDPLFATSLANTLVQAAGEPFTIDIHHVMVGVSVGIAETGIVGREPEALMAAADLALYEAKAGGGGRVRLYEPHMRDRFVAHRELQLELRTATQRGEFVLHYQPQVSLHDGRLIGCEALLRWQHPGQGLLYPNAFIAALESDAVAETVGWWVLDEACRQMSAWRRKGLDIGCIGVNLFSAQFRSPDFADRVKGSLERHGLPAGCLELEITETIALEQGEAVLAPLLRIRDWGVRLAFDDFGTGYASLSTLKRFPLTRLKIDRSFVRDLASDAHDAAIVKAVLAMGDSLGLSVIAEGIETLDQQALLLGLGCREGQGYLHGRGMPAEEIDARYMSGVRRNRSAA